MKALYQKVKIFVEVLSVIYTAISVIQKKYCASFLLVAPSESAPKRGSHVETGCVEGTEIKCRVAEAAGSRVAKLERGGSFVDKRLHKSAQISFRDFVEL